MAIFLLTGIPGSGKTYHAIKEFYVPAVKSGRRVYHNIRGITEGLPNLSIYLNKPLSEIAELVHEMPQVIGDNGLSVTDPYFYKQVEPNSLVICDEVQNIYYARNFQKNSHALNFMTQQRHLGLDIIMITQRVTMLDSSFRALADSLLDFRKLTYLGSQKSYRKLDYEGSTLTKDSLKTTTLHRYNPIYFQFYKSYDDKASGKESNFTGNILLSKKFLLMYAVIIITFGFAINRFLLSDRSILFWNNIDFEKKPETFTSMDTPEKSELMTNIPIQNPIPRTMVYYSAITVGGRNQIIVHDSYTNNIYKIAKSAFRPRAIFEVNDTTFIYRDINNVQKNNSVFSGARSSS
jgi:zona occludens toxin